MEEWKFFLNWFQERRIVVIAAVILLGMLISSLVLSVSVHWNQQNIKGFCESEGFEYGKAVDDGLVLCWNDGPEAELKFFEAK